MELCLAIFGHDSFATHVIQMILMGIYESVSFFSAKSYLSLAFYVRKSIFTCKKVSK